MAQNKIKPTQLDDTMVTQTELDTGLSTKQATGDYATNTALTNGLASKAATTHTHVIADTTGLQAALDGKQATGSYATLAGAETLTNKRLTTRLTTLASSATPTPNVDTDDQYNLTALAVNATFGAPTGTPTSGQKLLIRIKDDATARTLAWNVVYRAIGVTLPTTTVTNKTTYIGCVYNTNDLKFDVIAVTTEA